MESAEGGSMISALMGSIFDRMDSLELMEFFGEQKMWEKLKVTMKSIDAILIDAEERKMGSRAVKDWLRMLMDAVYEADDLLDSIAYEALRLKVENESQWSFLSFANNTVIKKKIESKLKEIFERLALVHDYSRDFHFEVRVAGGKTPISVSRPTTSLVDESRVFGREEDKEAIMRFLLSNDGDYAHVGVISIVGMGGIGKTTLAQLLFNDARVAQSFDLRAWVCVSDDFDVKKLSECILECLEGSNVPSYELDIIRHKISSRLEGKRFFLVLDDVWNEDYEKWEELMCCLNSVAKGSKIVVTSRSYRVATMMRSIFVHQLSALTDEECWLLFSEHAFGGRSSSAHPQLEPIAREIMRKCRGLPLAAKALGGLLRLKTDIREWEAVLNNEAWTLAHDYVLPTLRLQYIHLSSLLKRCFTYCAIFPKDYQFQTEELILLWMSEGFLPQPENNAGFMEVGHDVFEGLLSRSLFQRGTDESFTMHDLVHDLATLEAEDDCCSFQHNDIKISRSTRHLSFAKSEYADPTMLYRLHESAPLLRTILSAERLNSNSPLPKYVDGEKLLHSVSKLDRLRVLSFSGYDDIVKLPDSLGNLKHLRYLNFSNMSIKTLPDSLCNLYHLQTLILLMCAHLIELPANLGKLINLSYLDIGGTNLQQMPPWMGKLTKLQKLAYFIVGRQSECTIKELQELQHLRGKFCIYNLQNVDNAQDASKANLKAKNHLEKLELRWEGDTNNSLRDIDVLEQLQPHSNLRCLHIDGYRGKRFPNWIGDPSFSKLVSLKLRGCQYCSILPPLGQLESLKKLSIIAFDEIEAVGPDFYGSSTTRTPFRSLEFLTFERMTKWQEWFSHKHENEGAAFPLLKELYLIECPNLGKQLPDHLPSLQILVIEGCQTLLADSLPRAPSVLRMKLKEDHHVILKESEVESRNLETFKSSCLELFPEVEALRIITCLNLKSYPAFDEIFALVDSMEIWGCRDLLSFDVKAQNLTRLSLCGSSNLKSLPESMHSYFPSLEVLQVSDCPELVSFPAEGLPTKLKSLDIENCKTLIDNRSGWNLQLLPSLTHFRIGTNDDVESFPEKTLLPSSLASLEIENLHKLQSLDSEGLQHLTVLKELTIWSCPNLQSIPEEGLPISLSCLSICNCVLLEQRCQQGEDWSKISHISCVKINYHKIN